MNRAALLGLAQARLAGPVLGTLAAAACRRKPERCQDACDGASLGLQPAGAFGLLVLARMAKREEISLREAADDALAATVDVGQREARACEHEEGVVLVDQPPARLR